MLNFKGLKEAVLGKYGASILETGNVYAVNFTFAPTSFNAANVNSISLKHIVYEAYSIHIEYSSSPFSSTVVAEC